VGHGPFAVSGPIRFGDDFELDPRSQRLCRAGRVLKLERIPTDILLLLVENNGELVTRDQIIQRVWGEGVFLDTDNSINGAIRKIRQVLKDDPENPRFIQTVTGRGYRFIAPVAEPEAPGPVTTPVVHAATPAQNASLSDVDAGNSLDAKPAPWHLAGLIGIVVVLIAGLGTYLYNFRSRPAMQGPPVRSMLAVLPFENLTGDPEQEYFSDGLTEEMISQLGNLDPSHLGVIARTSVMHYKHTEEPLDRIGKELGVQYAIEGSVRRDSNKVRITAQLIQVKDQSHIWARQYDRDLSNLLALQAEIAQEIAGEIQLTLGDRRRIDTARRSPLSPQAYEAYDLYLKGRFFWNKRTAPGFLQAIDYFQQAIAKDPNYSRAYTGLADSYALLGGYSSTPQTESMPKARAAALKALELDPGLAEAHTSLALITENFDYDWETAEKEYRRAIELNPNYATAHHWYAEFLSLQGRFPEALAEIARARELDPLSLIIAADNGVILCYARQYDASIAQFRAVKEMEPAFSRAHMVIAPYVEKHQFADALAELEQWEAPGGKSAWTWAWRAFIYGRSGQTHQARQALAQVKQFYDHGQSSPDPMLWALIGVGDRDKAFVWFEKAYADHSNVLTSLKVNPAFDTLRSDPRFQNLMRRVRLAQ
jgi:TolB-like protein/DNA-binding winged helix-turn-helix (wHTH) protein/Tfp pilus assembly protein PilF